MNSLEMYVAAATSGMLASETDAEDGAGFYEADTLAERAFDIADALIARGKMREEVEESVRLYEAQQRHKKEKERLAALPPPPPTPPRFTRISAFQPEGAKQ